MIFIMLHSPLYFLWSTHFIKLYQKARLKHRILATELQFSNHITKEFDGNTKLLILINHVIWAQIILQVFKTRITYGLWIFAIATSLPLVLLNWVNKGYSISLFTKCLWATYWGQTMILGVENDAYMSKIQKNRTTKQLC